MPRIEVTPAALRGAGARASAVGGELRGLAGHIGPALAASGGAPPETAAALPAFSGAVQSAVAMAGQSVISLGGSVDAAAGCYEQTDGSAMPAMGGGLGAGGLLAGPGLGAGP